LFAFGDSAVAVDCSVVVEACVVVVSADFEAQHDAFAFLFDAFIAHASPEALVEFMEHDSAFAELFVDFDEQHDAFLFEAVDFSSQRAFSDALPTSITAAASAAIPVFTNCFILVLPSFISGVQKIA
jgi:hypothetical protein